MGLVDIKEGRNKTIQSQLIIVMMPTRIGTPQTQPIKKNHVLASPFSLVNV